MREPWLATLLPAAGKLRRLIDLDLMRESYALLLNLTSGALTSSKLPCVKTTWTSSPISVKALQQEHTKRSFPNSLPPSAVSPDGRFALDTRDLEELRGVDS